MNKIALFLFLGMGLLFSQMVQSEPCSRYYTEGRIGINFISNASWCQRPQDSIKFEPGIFVSASAGYRWDIGFRLEAEGGYRWNTIKYDIKDDLSEKFKLHGDLSNWSAMVNTYCDIPLCECVNGYLGVGCGYSYEKLSLRLLHYEAHNANNSFAWQVMTGISSPIWESTELALEYCFFQRFESRGIHNHDLLLGLRYYF